MGPARRARPGRRRDRRGRHRRGGATLPRPRPRTARPPGRRARPARARLVRPPQRGPVVHVEAHRHARGPGLLHRREGGRAGARRERGRDARDVQDLRGPHGGRPARRPARGGSRRTPPVVGHPAHGARPARFDHQAGRGAGVADGVPDVDTLAPQLGEDQVAELVVAHPAHPGCRAAQPGDGDGHVRLGTTDVQVQVRLVAQRADRGRAQRRHRLPEGDQPGHAVAPAADVVDLGSSTADAASTTAAARVVSARRSPPGSSASPGAARRGRRRRRRPPGRRRQPAGSTPPVGSRGMPGRKAPTCRR